MDRFGIWTKRLITSLLTAAMIVTSFPSYTLAAENEDGGSVVAAEENDQASADEIQAVEEPAEAQAPEVTEPENLIGESDPDNLTGVSDDIEAPDDADSDELLDELSEDLKVYLLEDNPEDPEHPIEVAYNPASPIDYGKLVYGYPSSSLVPLNIRIKYVGEGSLSVDYNYSTDNFYCYKITSLSSISKDDSVDLELWPKSGQAVGSYTDTIRFRTSSGNAIYTDFKAKYDVEDQVAKYHVDTTADIDNVDFGVVRYGDTATANECEETFTFINDGNIPLKFKISNYWAALNTEDDSFILEKNGTPGGKDTKVIKIKPDVSKINRGSFTVRFEVSPYRYSCPEYPDSTYISCKENVGYYLYGNVSASMLSENPNWTIADDTTITLSDSDDITISRINYNGPDDNKTLTIKGSDKGKLTVDGINTSGDLTIEHGTIRSKGTLESRKDLIISGGDVDAYNTFSASPPIDAGISGTGKVKIEGGNVRASGDSVSVAIKGQTGIEITNDAIVYAKGRSGIGVQAGDIKIDGTVYAEIIGDNGENEGNAIYTNSSGDLVIEGNATVHTVGGYSAISIKLTKDENIFIKTPIKVSPDGLVVKERSGHWCYCDSDNKEAKDIWFKPASVGNISFDKSSIDFGEVTYGDKEGLPDAVTVSVTNNSSFTEKIKSASAASEAYDIENLSGMYIAPGGQAKFKIRPMKKLDVNTYDTAFTVTTEAGTTGSVGLKYKVNETTAEIKANVEKLDFDKVKEGYEEVNVKSVTITNIGDGSVKLHNPVFADNDYVADLDKLDLAEGECATLTIRPETGLPAGDHSHDDFCIESDEGAFVKLPLTFVVEAWKYELSGESEEIDLGRMHVGYTTPAEKSFVFTNTGEMPLTISEIKTEKDYVTIKDKEEIIGETIGLGGTLPVTFIVPENKPRGDYSDKVTVKTAEGVECSVVVKYSVEMYIEGTVKASDLSYDFYHAYGDTTIILSPGDDVKIRGLGCTGNLTIIGKGSGKLSCDGTLESENLLKIDGGNISSWRLDGSKGVTICSDADVNVNSLILCGWDEGAISIGGNALVKIEDGYAYGNKLEVKDNAFLTIDNTEDGHSAVIMRDDINLAEGIKVFKPEESRIDTYLGQKTIIDESRIPEEGAKFVMIGTTASEGAGLEVKYTDINFGTYTSDDDIPEAREVTVVNTGRSIQVFEYCYSLDTNFEVTEQPIRSVLRPGETTTFKIRPVYLGAGEYVGAITVKYNRSDEVTIHPSATVVAPIYKLKLTHSGEDITDKEAKAIGFGTFAVGYEGGTPHEITVTNMGNTVLTMDNPAKDITSTDWGAAFGFTVSKLSKSVLKPNESATFTISVGSILKKLEDDKPYKVKVDVKGKFKTHEPSASAYGMYNVESIPKASDDTTNIIWMMDIPDQTYTGSAITPGPDVYFGSVKLTKDDYKVSYKNNTNAYTIKEGQPGFELSKAPTVTITGKGKYTGKMTKPFVIKPLSIENAYTDTDALFDKGAIDAHQTLLANGNVQKGSFKLFYNLPNGKKVTLSNSRNKDYELDYQGKEPKAPDLYTIKVKGHGNYDGERELKLRIADKTKTQISKVTFPKIPDQAYKGKKIIVKGTPKGDEITAVDKNGDAFDLVLTDRSTKHTLVMGADKDFEIYYADNLEIGTATVTVAGRGNYVGSVSKTFKITGTNLSKLKTNGYVKEFAYTGYEIKQPMKFLDGEAELVEGEHYTAEYTNNTEVGTATVVYTGKGKYFGTVKKTYKITGFSIGKVAIPKDFSGSKDFKDKYDAKSKAFIYTGEPFNVAGSEGGSDDQDIKLVYTFPDKHKETLQKAKDYKVRYTKNTDPGTATIEFIGIGKYYGTAKRTFKIKSYTITVEKPSDPTERITVYDASNYHTWHRGYNYDVERNYLKAGVCPEPIVEYNYNDNKRILEKGKDYTLSFTNNKAPGNAVSGSKPPTMTITGKGAFAGKLDYFFTIIKGDANTCTATATDYVMKYTRDDFKGCKVEEKYKKMKKLMIPISTKVTIVDEMGTKLKEGVDYAKPSEYTYEFGSHGWYDRVLENGDMDDSEFNDGDEVDTSKFGKETSGYYGKCYYMLRERTLIDVIIPGKGNYEGQTFECTFGYVYADVASSSVKVKIADKQYTGKPITLDENDITVTTKIGGTEKVLKLDEDYRIVRGSYMNNVTPGKASVTLEGIQNPGGGKGGFGGRKTFTFKIVQRRMNYHISYNNGYGDKDSGLVKALIDGPGWTEKRCKETLRITGIVKDSNIPIYGKLAANSFKVQSKDDKGRWVNDRYITFKCWRLYYDKNDPTKYKDFAPNEVFEPSWLTRFVYGDTYTMTAIWDL